jgi:gas vesicle protein
MGKELRKELEEYTSGIEKDVAGLLSDFANDREKMGSAVRKELGEYTSGIKKDVGSLLSEFSGARMETVKELKEIHEEWLRMVKPRAEVKKKVAEEEEEEEVEVEEVELGELKDKVLEIITSCPRGISLTGIGLKLDVEWRKLIRPAKDLLDEGKIRKEDLNYFPLKEKEN